MVKKQSTKKTQLPDGFNRLKYLQTCQDFILTNKNLPQNLKHKLNLQYGEIANMVTEKYLIKSDYRCKNYFCKRCKSKFYDDNFKIEVKVPENNKENKNLKIVTECLICGYQLPKTLRSKTKSKRSKKKTNFSEVVKS